MIKLVRWLIKWTNSDLNVGTLDGIWLIWRRRNILIHFILIRMVFKCYFFKSLLMTRWTFTCFFEISCKLSLTNKTPIRFRHLSSFNYFNYKVFNYKDQFISLHFSLVSLAKLNISMKITIFIISMNSIRYRLHPSNLSKLQCIYRWQKAQLF